METYPLTAVIPYVRDLPKMAQCYQQHFGYEAMPGTELGWQELKTPGAARSARFSVLEREGPRGRFDFDLEPQL